MSATGYYMKYVVEGKKDLSLEVRIIIRDRWTTDQVMTENDPVRIGPGAIPFFEGLKTGTTNPDVSEDCKNILKILREGNDVLVWEER